MMMNKKLFLIFLTIVSTLSTASMVNASEWYNGDYSYRYKVITTQDLSTRIPYSVNDSTGIGGANYWLRNGSGCTGQVYVYSTESGPTGNITFANESTLCDFENASTPGIGDGDPRAVFQDCFNCYHFDDGLSIGDSSPPDNDGTNSGASSIAGVFGTAVNLAPNDYIDVSADTSMDTTDKLTSIGWIYPIVYSGDRFWERKHTEWSLLSSGDIQVYMNGGIKAEWSGSNLPTSSWELFGFTYDKDAGGTDEIKIYNDQDVKATGDYSVAISYVPTDYNIGREDAGVNHITAYIDELWAYNITWTGTEWNQFYANSVQDSGTNNLTSLGAEETATAPYRVEIQSPTNGTINNSLTINYLVYFEADDVLINLTLHNATDGTVLAYNTSAPANATNNSITYTFLTDGTHEVFANTKSASGLDNQSVNHTISIEVAPAITIESPSNITYDSRIIDLNVSADLSVDSWWYQYNNNGTNITFTPNTTIYVSDISTIPNNIIVWANASVAGTEGSATVFFTYNTTPTIIVSSPLNETYSKSLIALDVSADFSIGAWKYSLDGASNITFTPNTTFTISTDGSHNVTIWANNSVTSLSNSTDIYFTVQNTSLHTFYRCSDNTGLGVKTDITFYNQLSLINDSVCIKPIGIDSISVAMKLYLNSFNASIDSNFYNSDGTIDYGTSTNVTFDQAESNLSVYLRVPKNATVINGSMNVSGFIVPGFGLGPGFVYTGINFSVFGLAIASNGMTWNGTYYSVSDTDTDKVYHFYPNGTYTGINFSVGSQSTTTNGITWNGTYYSVSDTDTERVYHYYPNGTYTGINFSVAGQGINPDGMTWNGTYYSVVDGIGLNVNNYYPNGTFAYSWPGGLGSVLSSTAGITNDGTYYTIVDNVLHYAFHFYPNGTYTGINFSVDFGANGITWNGTYYSIIDGVTDKVYHYGSFPTNVTIDVTNNSVVDWYYEGELIPTNPPQTITFSSTTIDDLNDCVNAGTSDANGLVYCSINVTSATVGIVRFDSLELNYTTLENLSLDVSNNSVIDWTFYGDNSFGNTFLRNLSHNPYQLFNMRANAFTSGSFVGLNWSVSSGKSFTVADINYGPYLLSATPNDNILTSNYTITIEVTGKDIEETSLRYYLHWNDSDAPVDSNTNGSFTYVTNGIDEPQNWTVNISDGFSNYTVSRSLNIDGTAPAPYIISPIATTYNDTQINFNGTVAEGFLDTMVFWLTDVNRANITNNFTYDNQGVNISIAPYLTGNGTYVLYFWANDTSGNENTTNVTFTVGLTQIITPQEPTPGSGGGGNYQGSSASFSFNANTTAEAYEPFTIRVRINLTDPQNNPWWNGSTVVFTRPTVTFSQSVNGTYTVIGDFSMIKRSNNGSHDAVYEITIDTLAPGNYSYFIETQDGNTGIWYYSNDRYITLVQPITNIAKEHAGVNSTIYPDILIAQFIEPTPKSNDFRTKTFQVGGKIWNTSSGISSVLLVVTDTTGAYITNYTMATTVVPDGTYVASVAVVFPVGIDSISIKMAVTDGVGTKIYSVSRIVRLVSSMEDRPVKDGFKLIEESMPTEGTGNTYGKYLAGLFYVIFVVGMVMRSPGGIVIGTPVGLLSVMIMASGGYFPMWVPVVALAFGAILGATALLRLFKEL